MTETKLMDKAGKPTGLASAERDITARKREEENLRRMATVVRDSNDAITIQDFEGRITAWNRGAEQMYGYGEAEALQINIDRLTTADKVAEQKEFIRRLVAGEDVTSFETQRATKDERVLDVCSTRSSRPSPGTRVPGSGSRPATGSYVSTTASCGSRPVRRRVRRFTSTLGWTTAGP